MAVVSIIPFTLLIGEVADGVLDLVSVGAVASAGAADITTLGMDRDGDILITDRTTDLTIIITDIETLPIPMDIALAVMLTATEETLTNEAAHYNKPPATEPE